jgi:hypothetical protein
MCVCAAEVIGEGGVCATLVIGAGPEPWRPLFLGAPRAPHCPHEFLSIWRLLLLLLLRLVLLTSYPEAGSRDLRRNIFKKFDFPVLLFGLFCTCM